MLIFDKSLRFLFGILEAYFKDYLDPVKKINYVKFASQILRQFETKFLGLGAKKSEMEQHKGFYRRLGCARTKGSLN